MVCEGFAEKSSTALLATLGVGEVKSNVKQKHVHVQYEPENVREPQRKRSLGRGGFTAVKA